MLPRLGLIAKRQKKQEDECLAAAQKVFLDALGVTGENAQWPKYEERKCRSLASALKSGAEIVIRNLSQVVVKHQSKSESCDDDLANSTLKVALKAVKAVVKTATEENIVAADPPCSVEGGFAHYEWYYVDEGKKDEEIDEIAEQIAAGMPGLLSSTAGRRLAEIANTDAAQDVAECDEKQECGQLAATQTPSSSKSETMYAGLAIWWGVLLPFVG